MIQANAEHEQTPQVILHDVCAPDMAWGSMRKSEEEGRRRYVIDRGRCVSNKL